MSGQFPKRSVFTSSKTVVLRESGYLLARIVAQIDLFSQPRFIQRGVHCPAGPQVAAEEPQ